MQINSPLPQLMNKKGQKECTVQLFVLQIKARITGKKVKTCQKVKQNRNFRSMNRDRSKSPPRGHGGDGYIHHESVDNFLGSNLESNLDQTNVTIKKGSTSETQVSLYLI